MAKKKSKPKNNDSRFLAIIESMTLEQRLSALWLVCQEIAKGRIPARIFTPSESQKRQMRRLRAKRKRS